LEQNYSRLEYIVMDGGSTDESVEIIGKYADRLSYWESAPDKGQADAIYRGFKCTSGEILGFVNSDDMLLPGALQTVGRYFRDHPRKECVIGGCIIIDGNGKAATGRLNIPSFTMGARVSFRSLLYFGCGFNQPASFWRRSAFEETDGFDTSLRFCFDYDLYLRLAQRKPFGNINEFLACFRIHEESKTSTLQSVQDRENELLWQKYGRSKSSCLRNRLLFSYYYRKYVLSYQICRAMIVLGAIRGPARWHW
jgi:glycosyltransferase involved in cell wall biosynthesis